MTKIISFAFSFILAIYSAETLENNLNQKFDVTVVENLKEYFEENPQMEYLFKPYERETSIIISYRMGNRDDGEY